jgi:molecular chaperone DnaK (HSP70)
MRGRQEKARTIETKNQADSMVYSTEKSLKEFGDKIDAVEKGNIENKLAELKKTMKATMPRLSRRPPTNGSISPQAGRSHVSA